jgi:hypothetical protein
VTVVPRFYVAAGVVFEPLALERDKHLPIAEFIDLAL